MIRTLVRIREEKNSMLIDAKASFYMIHAKGSAVVLTLK
jgi:hypothetical protein